MWPGAARLKAMGSWMGGTVTAPNEKEKDSLRHKGATQPGLWYDFPWHAMGDWKYLLYLPFVVVLALGLDDADRWCFHMMAVCVLRFTQAWVWNLLSRNHFISGKTRIQGKGVEFKQIDRESNWDDYIILQLYVATAVHCLPFLYCSNGVCHAYRNFPLYDGKGLVKMLLIHAGPTEFIYYWLHRALHLHSLYARYHSHHHASFVPEAVTGSVHPFMEHLMYTINFAIPLLGTWLAGGASVAMIYTYLLGFDLMNIIGHCNFEIFPVWPFKVFPFLKYIIYTPSFHSLHHSRVVTNFCLFMPMYDWMYGTLDPKSWDLFDKAAAGNAVQHAPPETVFLAHGTELLSVFHLPFMSREFSSKPFQPSMWMYILWPIAVPMLLLARLFGTVFVADKHRLGAMRIETWVTPAWAIDFFFKSQWGRINRAIDAAITDADKAGVKVFGLGALNKNEALNGGGALFVKNHPDLTMRVVHGNTLTAAAIIKTIPADVKKAFVLGATSKLGRGISLYLAKRGVTVVMLTQSEERYAGIVKDCPEEFRKNLVHSTNIADGEGVACWVVGRFLSKEEQHKAPKGAAFHQFVVPPLDELRKDCVYTKLPAFTLPENAAGFKSCEMTMQRRDVHACHAGALVHALEKWTHHEVGAIDEEKIDRTWDAAMKHGFKMVC